MRDNLAVRTFRGAWSLAGLAAGAAGLATSYFVAMAMTIRESPVVAVAELVIRLTPGWLAEYLIGLVGHLDKPLLLLGIFVVLGVVFAWAGRLARRTWWAPSVVYAVLAADRGRGRLGAARCDRDRRRPGGGRLRDLAGHPVAAHRAVAHAPSWPSEHVARVPAPSVDVLGAGARPVRRPRSTDLRDPGRPDRGRRRGARRRRPGRGPRTPARRGVASAAAAAAGDRATGAGGRPGRAQGRLPVADRERRASTGSTPRSSYPRSSPRTGRCASTARSTARSP